MLTIVATAADDGNFLSPPGEDVDRSDSTEEYWRARIKAEAALSDPASTRDPNVQNALLADMRDLHQQMEIRMKQIKDGLMTVSEIGAAQQAIIEWLDAHPEIGSEDA